MTTQQNILDKCINTLSVYCRVWSHRGPYPFPWLLVHLYHLADALSCLYTEVGGVRQQLAMETLPVSCFLIFGIFMLSKCISKSEQECKRHKALALNLSKPCKLPEYGDGKKRSIYPCTLLSSQVNFVFAGKDWGGNQIHVWDEDTGPLNPWRKHEKQDLF